ncbi:F-box protein At1g11270-like isoform X1 [Trifolium pratense]|uniref:F-box protein At1g11270-like isoform X1 n=2 Tax=Trifolium pratense TaxID=57577 RepID=UPI001E697C71|nr:F-box protein At1g11270-like isoform X1 [Trifolium pratense]XP_045821555.1 F-box protein At1g11270-like isoform X1 [Trifolium pratense]XP_045821556.1 F-box protein At1g11270-like isoform X1 [Trifolium pratense]
MKPNTHLTDQTCIQEKVSNYMPDEISYSILSKLPLKSLKRFECVQKSWSILFENHHFMNMFRDNLLSYSDPASLILRVFKNRKQLFYSFSGERFENNKVKLDWSNPCENYIFGSRSINGTFCLHGSVHYSEIVLWTPATQTRKLLPDSVAESFKMFIPDEADVSFLYHVQGFGYDRLINDYKVIRYVGIYVDSYPGDEDWLEDLDSDHLWEIYSLRSNSWRKLHVDMPYTLQCYGDTQIYMDGVCHWLCEHYNFEPCLVSFYLSNEEFFVTPIPSDVDDCFDVKVSWINLAVLNESIALISYHTETTTFHISILSEFGMKESWTKLFIAGPLPCVERPIIVGTKGEIFFIRKDEELVWLDLSTQMIRELGYKREPYTMLWIIIYKDGILSIEGQ